MAYTLTEAERAAVLKTLTLAAQQGLTGYEHLGPMVDDIAAALVGADRDAMRSAVAAADDVYPMIKDAIDEAPTRVGGPALRALNDLREEVAASLGTEFAGFCEVCNDVVFEDDRHFRFEDGGMACEDCTPPPGELRERSLEQALTVVRDDETGYGVAMFEDLPEEATIADAREAAARYGCDLLGIGFDEDGLESREFYSLSRDYENGGVRVLKEWRPEALEAWGAGWTLAAVFDTEDGVRALFVLPRDEGKGEAVHASD